MLKQNRLFNFLLALIFTIVSVCANIIPVFAQIEPVVIANTSMNSSRSEFGSVAVYGNVFIIGGTNSSGFLNTVEKYDVYSNRVSNESSMSIKRSSFGATAYKNKIYVIGGKTLTGTVGNIEVYDTDNKTWSQIGSMPVPKHSFKSVLLNGKIYIIGGVSSQGVSGTVEVYDIEKNTWSNALSMSTARCNLAVAVYENKIYAIGGKTADNKVSNVVELYDEISNTWEKKSNILTAREGLSAEVLDNYIYVLGGSSTTNVNTVEVFNPQADKWYVTRSFSQPVTNAEIVSVNRKLIVIGGKNGTIHLNTIKEYNPRFIEDILHSISKFSQASEEDKKIITSHFNTQASIIQQYESQGYSLSAILNSITYLNTYKLRPDSLNAIINDKDILNVTGELSRALNQITLFNNVNKLSEEKALESKQLVLDKVDIKVIEGGYNAYKVIVSKSGSLSTLTLKEIIDINKQNVPTESEIQQVLSSRLSKEAISMLISYEKYSAQSGSNVILNVKSNINNYYSDQQKNVTGTAVLNGEGTLQQSGTNIEDIKKSIDSAYNTSKYNKEEVDAINGSVKNDYSALQLEGKGGLDLNISASYDSLDAGLKVADYRIDSGAYIDSYGIYKSDHITVAIMDTNGLTILNEIDNDYERIASASSLQGAIDEIETYDIYGLQEYNFPEWTIYISHEYSYYISEEWDSYSNISTTSKDNYNYNYNKLGLGWQFNFSSIETNDKGKFLHIGDGRTYKINGSSLEGYDFKDIVFYDQNSYNSNAPAIYKDIDTNISSRYVLEYKDKSKEYFTTEGRLLAVVDKNGNKIRYQYTVDGSNKVTKIKIIDTRDRVVEISYLNNMVQLKKPSGDLVNFILEDKTELSEGTTYNYKVLKEIQEVSADNSQRRVTSYGYNNQVGLQNTGKFSYESSSGGLGNIYAKLNSVNYTTGASTIYTFEKVKGYLGNTGYFDYYRAREVVKKSNASDLTPYKAQYTYEGDYTKDSGHKTTKTALGNNGKGTKTIFNYNANHTVGVEETYSVANNTKLVQTLYEYDSRKMPNKQTTTTYYYDANNTQTGSTASLVEMEYDIYKDKTWEVDVNGVKTYYDYNSKYHQVENVRKNVDGKELRAENILNASNGAIEQTIAYHKENGVDKPIKSFFEYNVDGTVKKTINASDNNPKYKYSATEYLYNENYILDGYVGKTYSISTTTKFKDSNLQEKVLTETSIYDYKTGNLICSIDGKGNKITYKYDYLDRSTALNYPDITKTDGAIDQANVKVQYFDNTNTVIAKDENNHHTMSIYDGLGVLLEKREVKKGIDEKNIDVLNNTIWYTVQKNQYNNLGQLIKVIDAKNNSTTFDYDELGREIKRTFANSTTIETKYTYVDGRNVKITYNEEKEPIEQHYDIAGNVVKEIVYRDIMENNQEKSNVTCVTTNEYNSLNNLVKQTDAKGNVTTNNYDDLGRLLSVVNAKGEKTAYEYDNMSNVSKMVTDQGSIVDKEYNEIGKLIRETMKETATTQKSEFITYDETGNVNSKVDKAGVATNYQYDSRNRITKESKGNIVIYYDYSNASNKKTVIKEVVDGQQINRESATYEYYADGKLKKEITPDNKFIEYKYDDNNNRSEVKDHFAKITTYSYDNVNKLKTVTIDGKTTTYDYYLDGNVKQVSYPNSVNEIYTYTRDNNIKTLTNQKADGTKISKYIYNYDKSGNQISKKSEETKGIVSEENYNYDQLDRLIYTKDLIYTDNLNGVPQTTSHTETKYTFDKNGNIITKVTNDDYGNTLSTVNYEYDLTNKLKRSDEALKVYNIISKLTSSSYSVKAGDTVNLQLSAKLKSGEQAPANYFESAVWSTSLPEFKLNSTNGQSATVIVTQEVYSKMIENKPVKVSAVIAGKTLEIFIYKSTPTMTKPIKSISINSDKNTVSNRQNVTFTLSAKYSDDTDVEDSVLKDAIWTSENTMLKLTSSIGKIAVGAYLYITTINKGKGYDYTQEMPLLSCVPLKVNVNLKGLTGTLTIDGIPTGDLNLESTRPIEYLAVNMTTKFYYDTNGNLIKKVQEQAGVEKSLEEYSYNVLNQLKSYKNNTTGKAATYNYFVDGLRKSKVVNGTTTNYYNDGSNVIIETDGNNNLTARNIIGIKNIGRQESNGIINYFLYNAHGDITQLIGNTGEIVNSYEYDIYGKAKDSTEKIKNPIRYAGQYYDEESGLYYLRARYYSPDIMRFISEDSYRGDIRNPESLNLYGYCVGDPIGFVDPSGNAPQMDHETGDIYLIGGNGKWFEATSHVYKGKTYITVKDPEAYHNSYKHQISNRTMFSGAVFIYTGNPTGFVRSIVAEVAGKGELHHIASDKSLVSGFTAQYEKIFKNAGMNLQDDANLIFLEGHSGAHTKVYKQYVLDYITNATKGLKGNASKEALTKALTDLKDQLIKNPKMPYKGGL